MVSVKEIEKLQIDHEINNNSLSKILGISVQALLKKKKGVIRWSLDDAVKIKVFFNLDDQTAVKIFLR